MEVSSCRLASLHLLRLEEDLVRVRPVDRSVAHRTGLVFLRLVVERGNRSRTRIYGEGMALKANQVHLAALEQPRIRRAMWHVAGLAAFDLYCLVLVHKRPSLVRVTLETHRILRRRGP